MVLGHPVVALSLTVAGGYGLYLAWAQSNALLAIGTSLLLGKLVQANEQASRYRAWAKAWQAMDPDASPPRPMTRAHLLGLLVGVGLPLLWVVKRDAFAPAAACVGMLLGGILLVVALRAIIRKAGRRTHRPAKVATVTVVARRVLPVPSLADAYRALPAHCRAVMGLGA